MDRELPPDFDVDYQLTRLVRQVRARSLRNLATIHDDLDYSTFVLLLAVVDADDTGIRASDLAESMHVHKSTVSRAVRLLEKMSLLERTPHPEDGRAHVLRASDDARERVEAYRRSSHGHLATIIEDWEPTELRTFAQLLARLNDAFGGDD